MTDFIQVFITINDKARAKEIAEVLLDKGLAACVQINGPLTSIYKWEDKLVEDQEWLLIAKSSKVHYSELEKQVKEIHVYEVPEILAVKVENGNEDYLSWLNRELK
jgi:periplasmic divalent cation tolerance protein